MHAVVAIFAMPKPDGVSPPLRGIVERVSQEPGFVAGYWTHDGERAYNMLVFDSLAAAEQRAADVRGNTTNQTAAGIILERVTVSEVIAHATPPTAT
jgi:hypothetical protein